MEPNSQEAALQLLGERRCPRCMYDLRGIEASPCPECGYTLRAHETVLIVRDPILGLASLSWDAAFVVVFLIVILRFHLPLTSVLSSVGWIPIAIVPRLISKARRHRNAVVRTSQIWLAADGMGFVHNADPDRVGIWLEHMSGWTLWLMMLAVATTSISIEYRLVAVAGGTTIAAFVAMFLVCRKGLSADGTRPILVPWASLPEIEVATLRNKRIEIRVCATDGLSYSLPLPGGDAVADVIADRIDQYRVKGGIASVPREE